MSKRKKSGASGTMLELWRPPAEAGDPIGCLTTTYTFNPGFFDEQCLARFLEIDSEPGREDLAFLLERECKLGGVYAGVLVDFTQAGVEHSLRWDVLPVRVPNGKQHAKISLLAWTRHIRIIVASANLTEPGYRSNFEVAATVELSPTEFDVGSLVDVIAFLGQLLELTSGAGHDRPEAIKRAEAFLRDVEKITTTWAAAPRSKTVRRKLVLSLPRVGTFEPQSALESAVHACRARGASPNKARIASPFFDTDSSNDQATASLCKMMARQVNRDIAFYVPGSREEAGAEAPGVAVPRLAAPKSLLLTARKYQGVPRFHILPELEDGRNRRPWHAKMLALSAEPYAALLIGSSNFTSAGMGIGNHRNTEANLLIIADRSEYGRDIGQLEAIWPAMEAVENPDAAEWLGARPELEEEEMAASSPLPAGFESATYCAGAMPRIIVRLNAERLPDSWTIYSQGGESRVLLTSAMWLEGGQRSANEIAWERQPPPDLLLVSWADGEACMPLNVQDGRDLQSSVSLKSMSADAMLLILAASDSSEAIRAWAKNHCSSDLFDSDLDSAVPADIDPLRQYDLHATFLHRVRRRALVLARVRANLERPVRSIPALEWRLRGSIGIGSLARRLLDECALASTAIDEAWLTMIDFMIVLDEVLFESVDGSLSKPDCDAIYRAFLKEIANTVRVEIEPHRGRLAADVLTFSDRVLEKCRA